MRIFELLAEGYPDTISAFKAFAAADVVQKTVGQFRDLVNRNQVQGNERNIDWWRKQGWEKFSQFVSDNAAQATKTQVKRRRAIGQSITLEETPDWLIVIPLDHDASCFHGRGSDWCTARPTAHYFDDYFLNKDVNLIYCINKTSGDNWAIATHPNLDQLELFDQQNQSITAEQFHSATGFDPNLLVKLIPHNDPRIAQVKTVRRALLADIKAEMQTWIRGVRQRNPKLEALLIKAKDPYWCDRYIENVGHTHGVQDFPQVIAMAAVRAEDPEQVNLDYNAIMYIHNPSLTVQMAAAKTNGLSIQHINHPSDAVQMAAVEQNGSSIQFIQDPTPKVIATARSLGFDQNGNKLT